MMGRRFAYGSQVTVSCILRINLLSQMAFSSNQLAQDMDSAQQAVEQGAKVTSTDTPALLHTTRHSVLPQAVPQC